MNEDASYFFRSPTREPQEKVPLMTSPPNQAIYQSNWGADQIVQLLKQGVDKKIDWEHQKLLLWNDGFSEPIQFSSNIFVDQEAIKSERKFFEYQDNYQGNTLEKQEVKTPECINFLDCLSPIKIVLELDSQLKKQAEPQVIKCRCKKSKCLKMYCQCFRAGKQCKDCGCNDCKNHEDAGEERKKVMLMIQEKQPTAFTDSSQYKGCKCTKSQCQKGYCECFLNGHMCGKYCRCRDCLNCKSEWMSRQKKWRK